MRGGKMKSEEYAEFVCFNYQLLKQTCPECKLVLGGISSRPNEYYKFYQKVIEAAKGSFDILDFHWAGMYGDYKSLYGINFKKLVSDIKDDLKNNNTKADIWITEMSTYSGDPQDLKVINFPYQSERQQAIELVKRYVYPLSAGVKKIFWVKIIEWYGFARKINGFYDNTGLVNNPLAEGDSSGKLSFYTYKKMIEVLDGSDWNNIQTIQEKDGIYIYKFTKNGKPIWVAWNDNAEKKEITISDITPNQFLITAAVPNFESGKEIMDYNTAFETEKKVVLEGSVTINIADSPIYIEML